MQDMNDVYKLLEDANKSINIADHITYVTYPLIKDIKFIMKIAENINHSATMCMDALLYYDWLYKRISHLPDNFDSRLDIFKRNTANRYNIDRQNIVLLEDLKILLENHKKSHMEFVRNNKYIICSANYKGIKTIDINKIKDYLEQAKSFVTKVNGVLNYDRISSRRR